MKDKLNELIEALKLEPDISAIEKTGGLKSYVRYEKLPDNLTSIVIRPVGPPEGTGFGSNGSLAKHFTYQVSIESIDRMTCKILQKKVETIFKTKGFYQSSGGLDEYFTETKRYVDARFYEGNSNLYEDY